MITQCPILVKIFWHFLLIQLTSESPQVKRYLISSITNLAQELPHELPNDLGLRILQNQEILEKCQMWVQTQPNAQSSFQKLNDDNSCQKTCRIRYYIFEVLLNFIVFLYFEPNIFSRIVVSSLPAKIDILLMMAKNSRKTENKLFPYHAILHEKQSQSQIFCQ